MIEAAIALAVVAAAVYLLRPLFRRGGGRHLLILLPVGIVAFWAPPPAQTMTSEPSIGWLLIAVDAQRDHLRVSEAARVVNPGSPRVLDLVLPLPPGAVYVTFHRGLGAPSAVPGGFRDRLYLPSGVREVVYSYALPSGREQALTRAFPLPVRRMEIVARGRGIRLTASRGRSVDALAVGGDGLPRWEVQDLAAGQSVTILLRGLPASRPWLPAAAAGVFAALLAGGLSAAAAVRARAAPS